MVMGTIAYMSPEQASGHAMDARSDIFSIGVVLYELIAGHRPFAGRTDLELLQRIIHGTAEPLTDEVPAMLRLTLEKALAKDPAERYQSMRDMVVDLKRLVRHSGESPAPRTKARKRPPQTGAKLRWAGAALAPVLAVAGWYGWRTWRVPESNEPLQAVPLTSLQGSQRYPTFSPDGNYVAFTWTGPKQDNPDLYVYQVGSSGTPLQLTTDPGNDYNPVWSPDGRWIGFLRRAPGSGTDEVRLIPPLGGTERKLAEIHVRGGDLNSPPYLSWCPDATCLVATDSPGDGKPDGLFVISFETGEKRALTNPAPPTTGDTEPVISPDGGWLIFRRTQGGVYDGELYRLHLGKGVTAAGEPIRLTPSSLDAQYPAWLPDSRQILFSTAAGGLWRLSIAGDRPGAPERLPFIGEGGQMPVVSRPQNGQAPRLVYVRGLGDANVGRIDTSAAGAPASSPPVVSPISSTRDDGMVHLSADGRRAAFWSVRSGFSEIWVANLDGSQAHQITSIKGFFASGAPRWSQDGEWITYHSNGIWIIPSAGGKARKLTADTAINGFPSFSHDGRWIYYSSNRETHTQQQVFKMPVSGGEPVRLTTGFGVVPVESADGNYLYYVESIDKPSPLWRIPVSGGDAVRILDGVVLGNYDLTAKGIYYIDMPQNEGSSHYADQPSGETRLEYYDLATRRATRVARNLGLVDVGLTATPDGRTILYSRVDASVNDLMLVENFR
jgi:Tol biopolymer transport system component